LHQQGVRERLSKHLLVKAGPILGLLKPKVQKEVIPD